MKVFMLGWEFPPFISGGLGTACHGLTKAMGQLNVGVTFVLPRMVQPANSSHVKILSPSILSSVADFEVTGLQKVRFHAIHSALRPYTNPDYYRQHGAHNPLSCLANAENLCDTSDYECDMYGEVHKYAHIAAQLASREEFDVIHAHDWMTFPAGLTIAKKCGKPLIVHVHSTEFDRSGEHVNQVIYNIERAGMHAADKVIAVSHLTRNIIISRYGINDEKVEVVHNGVDLNSSHNITWNQTFSSNDKNEKIVLFLGRITMQKGPEYFLQAAKKVLEVMGNVKFVMAGSGDMMRHSIELAAELGIGSKVVFTGFLRGREVQEIYKMADLFVMPSVSEPFGLVPLEALDNDVPVIISKQSGVSEVLRHALKVDFWDTEEMANKIISVLRHPALRTTLQNHGNFEVRKLQWKDSARKCLEIYENALTATTKC